MMKRPSLVMALVAGLAVGSPVLAASGQGTSPTTALDLVGVLSSGGDYRDILERSLTANTRVEPEHLGVAFYNTETGGRLDRNEIRELMGPVRQDGAYQLMALAVQFSGDSLPYNAEQLELLLDAAFMASMRRPPQHISIEYYDVREGPTGIGGGVSGRVPEPGS